MKTLNKVILCLGVAALILAAVASLAPKSVAAAIATLVRDQDNPARHTFQASCASNGFPGPTGFIVASCSIPVPAGQEYVITSATVSGTSSTFDPVLVGITTTAGGVGAGAITGAGTAVITPYNSAAIVGYSSGATATFVYETHGAIYADAGSSITVSAYPFVFGPQLGVQLNVQGHYVTLP
jgi:hypothetical protein